MAGLFFPDHDYPIIGHVTGERCIASVDRRIGFENPHIRGKVVVRVPPHLQNKIAAFLTGEVQNDWQLHDIRVEIDRLIHDTFLPECVAYECRLHQLRLFFVNRRDADTWVAASEKEDVWPFDGRFEHGLPDQGFGPPRGIDAIPEIEWRQRHPEYSGW